MDRTASPRRILSHSAQLVALFLSVLAAGGLCARAADDVPTALLDYVARPEPAYGWRLLGTIPGQRGTAYEVELTSQEWQGIVWKHALHVFQPAEVQYPEHVLLFVSGGKTGGRPNDLEQGLTLARLTGAPVAILSQVPNQPLFGGRVEDDLITETWLRYLDTGDATWPLLFPMVKSAVKAMDAVEELAAREWKGKVKGFVITGGSKRGWTSWLTPVADKRVIATAPIVIDVLNFQPQMRHQLDTWGKYSEQIRDYTSKGLIKLEDESDRELALRMMMDPYTYRNRLALPKLIINGTNDPYWVVDANNFYWFDLVGPKYLLKVPNAGHGLEGGRELAYSTLAAFFRHVASATPMPELEWTHQAEPAELQVRVRSSETPTGARVWSARSADKDFRDAQWTSAPMVEKEGEWIGRIDKPQQGYVALYGELAFEFQGVDYSLCTLIHQQ
ncbi:MAG: PhoPQ-activated pathogenicity-related family protein [Thermoguttaceae bacterium]